MSSPAATAAAAHHDDDSAGEGRQGPVACGQPRAAQLLDTSAASVGSQAAASLSDMKWTDHESECMRK